MRGRNEENRGVARAVGTARQVGALWRPLDLQGDALQGQRALCRHQDGGGDPATPAWYRLPGGAPEALANHRELTSNKTDQQRQRLLQRVARFNTSGNPARSAGATEMLTTGEVTDGSLSVGRLLTGPEDRVEEHFVSATGLGTELRPEADEDDPSVAKPDLDERRPGA